MTSVPPAVGKVSARWLQLNSPAITKRLIAGLALRPLTPVPRFELAPETNPGDRASAAFTFALRRHGFTAHGSGLAATIVVRLRSTGPHPGDLRAALEIPFLDGSDADGRTRTRTFPATVATAGAISTLTIELAGDFVELAYGALAFPDLQDRRARLVLSFSPNADVPANAPPRLKRPIALPQPILARLKLPVLRPVAKPAPGASVSVDLAFDCRTDGWRFLELVDGEERPLGCTHPPDLDQLDKRVYDEVPDASTPELTVLASRKQLGSFVAVPRRYRLTRRPPGSPDEHRPWAALYSALDGDVPEANRVVLLTGLQPDLTPGWAEALRRRLATPGGEPRVELVTDAEGAPEVTWAALPPGFTVSAAARLDGVVEVSFAGDLAGAALLGAVLRETELSGTARFEIEDGTAIETSLTIDLASPAGPWPDGPVSLHRLADPTTLGATNHIDRPVHLLALRVVRPDGMVIDHRVGVALPAAASTTVTVGDLLLGPADVVLPLVEVGPGEPAVLAETRTFTEDLRLPLAFSHTIDLAARGLARLDVDAALDADDEIDDELHTFSLTDDQPTIGFELLLPLARFAAQPRHTLRYRVRLVGIDERVREGAWVTWDLASGSHIALTWPLSGFDEVDQ